VVEQKIFDKEGLVGALNKILEELQEKKVFVVCGSSCSKLPIVQKLSELPVEMVWFDGFAPNPTFSSVCEGTQKFRQSGCKTLLVIGGGSAMDVAKCIKLYSSMDPEINYLEQEMKDNDVKLIAVPTTAGTGSEATRYAVIYYQGEKQSVHHLSIVPEYVILEPKFLETLPMYQRQATMLDALCHALESWWSVNSTEESKEYAEKAVKMVLKNAHSYLCNNEEGNRNMLLAANLAGKAINITQTTAPHAMCYKITTICGLSHGHAVALSLPKVWRYMLKHPEKCIDPRGSEYLMGVLKDMARALECETAEEGPDKFEALMFDVMHMEVPTVGEETLSKMVSAVNLTRLKNNPVQLDQETLEKLYRKILKVQ